MEGIDALLLIVLYASGFIFGSVVYDDREDYGEDNRPMTVLSIVCFVGALLMTADLCKEFPLFV